MLCWSSILISLKYEGSLYGCLCALLSLQFSISFEFISIFMVSIVILPIIFNTSFISLFPHLLDGILYFMPFLWQPYSIWALYITRESCQKLRGKFTGCYLVPWVLTLPAIYSIPTLSTSLTLPSHTALPALPTYLPPCLHSVLPCGQVICGDGH